MGFYSVVKAVESTLWSFRPSRGSSSYTVEMGVPPIRAHARGRPRRVSQTIRSAPRSEAHCLRVSTKPLNSRHAGVVSRPRSNAGTAAWAPASKPPRARRCGRHLGPAFPPTISLRRPARIPGVSRHDDAGAARSVAAFPVSVTPSIPRRVSRLTPAISRGYKARFAQSALWCTPCPFSGWPPRTGPEVRPDDEPADAGDVVGRVGAHLRGGPLGGAGPGPAGGGGGAELRLRLVG
jgi:hypothetical protein